MNKKLNSNSSAGTAVDSDKMPKIPTSSHACSNTFVARSQSPTSKIEVLINVNTLFITFALYLLIVCFLTSLSLYQYFVIESL